MHVGCREYPVYIRTIPRQSVSFRHDAESLGRVPSFCLTRLPQKARTLRNNLSEASGREPLAALPEAGLRAEQMRLNALLELHRNLL